MHPCHRCANKWCIGWSLLAFLLVTSTYTHAERAAIRTYTTADGLPSTFIHHIAEDSRGFLWFATRDGLSRFDGYRFVTYGTSDGLPVSTINFLLQRRDHSFWVATNGGGVCRFEPAAKSKQEPRTAGHVADVISEPRIRPDHLFTCYTLGDYAASNRVNHLHEDRSGTLWAGTDSGLFRLRPRDVGWGFERVPIQPAGLFPSSEERDGLVEAINPLLEDREGSLWIGTAWGLVRRLPDGRMLHIKVRPSANRDGVSSLLEDSEGRLWIGHTGGLFVFVPEPAGAARLRGAVGDVALADRAVIYSVAKSTRLADRIGEVAWYRSKNSAMPALYRSRDGSIWCGMERKLLRFDGRTHAIRDIHEWAEVHPGSIAEDRHGNLWLGGTTAAFKLLLDGFTTFDAGDGLAPTYVHSIFQDPGGNVVVATDRWWLHHFDGKRFTSSRMQLSEDITAAWGSQRVFVDSASRWWALTTIGLFRFQSLQRTARASEPLLKRYTRQDGLSNDSAVRLFEHSNGDIWIGTRSASRGGLSRWERSTDRIHRYLNSSETTPREATAFAEDQSKTLWVGFYDGGLARVRHGDVSFLSEEVGVPAGQVAALYVDAANRLWIATAHSGVARLDDPSATHPRFVRYTTANGLGSDNVRCITEDRQGRLYFGTVRGVDRLDPGTGRMSQYTMADGLPNSFVTAAFRDREGILWFGTANGTARLLPQPDILPDAPPIFISGVRVAGVQYPVSELGETSLRLPSVASNQNRVQFDFHGLEFGMGERLRYEYRLDGVDREWNPTTDERSVTYASLAPGEYTFLVRAINTEGIASQRLATATFTILQPIWKQWWFLATAFALAGVVVAMAHRSRVRHLLSLERVRMGIATDLHDDIGSNLSQIAILSEVARRQMEPNGLRVAGHLERIAHLSRASVDSMSDIVWATNPEKDSAANLVTRMRNLANEVLAAREIDFVFHITGEPHTRLDAELRRQVFLLFKESLNNVVRHSGSVKVNATLHLDRHALILRVQDHGKGFDAAHVSSGEGLQSMQRRAASIGGRLDVVSSPTSGTALTLTVPRRWPGPTHRGRRSPRP